jgi:uncharacterized protein YbcI
MDVHELESRPADNGQASSQISRKIVQIHARLYGRGPTRAKTYVNTDYVMTVLEEIFTPAERTLVDAGRREEVESTRAAFQDTVGKDFIAIVEAAASRKVRGFISAVHLDSEVAVELFLLEPLPDPGAPAGSDGHPGRNGHPSNDGHPSSDGHVRTDGAQ